MASLVLTIGGSVLGNAIVPGIGGALLGGVGAYVGGQIDAAVFGSSKISGPRLDNLKIQDSAYGKTIPVLYGNARVSGNVIWSSDLIETLSSSSVGGKGGGSSTAVERASYSVDCAIALGMGARDATIGGIRTIWADSKIIYSDGVWSANSVTDAEFYYGDEIQNPSPLMESYLGVGNVPAYRGVAYVVLHRLQLANFGNRIPNITFEFYPADAAPAPELLGEMNPVLVSRPSTLASYNAMPAIPLAYGGSSVSRMAMGGILKTSTAFQFVVMEMDVSGDAPVELNRTLSASVTRSGDLSDVAWALSPDQSRIVFYMLHSDSGNPATFAIYHIASRSFGALLTDHLGYPAALNQITWLDEQRFVLPDEVSGQVGVRVYALSGNTIIALGFNGVWGVGSSATRFALPFAQFCKLSGGAMMLMANATSTPTHLYARSLRWQNNALQVGSEILLSSALASFSSSKAAIIPLSHNEFVLGRMGTSQIRLLSFTANFSSVSVTRNWTTLSVSPSGDISLSIKGGVLCFLHQSFTSSNYRYGEISVTATSFTLALTSTVISGSYSGTLNYFSFYPINASRLVMQASGSSGNLSRIAIITRGDVEHTLDALVSDILLRAGYDSSDVDVSTLSSQSVQGYVVDHVSSARAALEPLQLYHPFDLVESDGILKARPYTANADIIVDASETRSVSDRREHPAALQIMRSQELDLPREITVDYLDPNLDFQRNTQRAQRITSSARAVDSMRLPVVCPAQKAKQIAETQLYRRWIERQEYEMHISRAYTQLDVGDVVSFSDHLIRITHIDHSGGILKTRGVPVSEYVLASDAVAQSSNGTSRTAPPVIGTTLYMMDVPLLRGQDDQPGFYVAMSGVNGWRGASLMRATDGINYTVEDRFSLPSIAGFAASVLPPCTYIYMDRASSVTVSLLYGALASCSQADLLNGANAALLGDEIIQFQTATLNGDGSYTLSNLLRGRKGSEAAIATHVLGERFVLLQSQTLRFLPLNSNDRDRILYYRAPSLDQNVQDVADTVFVPQMNGLKPLAPTHIYASRNSSLDIALNWKRRARSNAEWVDGIDVPLDESSELYDVEVMSGSSVVRSFLNQPTPSLNYTAAQQVTDFGAVQAAVTFKIYQLSARYGRGAVAQATL